MSGPTSTTGARPPLKIRRAADIDAALRKYPTRRSAVMDILYMVQEDDGWVSPAAMEEVAEICHMLPSQVEEMVTFYMMYHRRPVGRHVLAVCGTLPCALCGAAGLLAYLQERLGVGIDEITPDGLFTIKRVECLGACSEAPLMLVNRTLACRLTRQRVDEWIERCRRGT